MELSTILGPVAELTIICLALGLLFLLIELFTPGFGAAGTVGLIMLGVVIVLQLVWGSPVAAAYIIAGVLVIIVVAILLVIRSLQKGRLSKSFLVLDDKIDTAATSREEMQAQQCLVGNSGSAVTPLRPAGIADIGGKRLDVMTEGEFVAAGASLTVTRVEGLHVLVKECKDQ